uniref:DNA-directed RNA polymerase n=1 Tax=Steinernema glaseri TaxID=37863 RepID=A0A1I7ZWE7_9BILA
MTSMNGEAVGPARIFRHAISRGGVELYSSETEVILRREELFVPAPTKYVRATCWDSKENLDQIRKGDDGIIGVTMVVTISRLRLDDIIISTLLNGTTSPR